MQFSTIGDGRKYLVVNLATETWEVRLLPLDAYERLAGGEALALALWHSFAMAERDPAGPMEPANPVCIASGALAGTGLACTGGLSVCTRSALTGTISCGYGAGAMSAALKRSGWAAVVLVGSARRPVLVDISMETVKFHSAGRLVGLRTAETTKHLEVTQEDHCLCIGPAGENLVPLSCLAAGGVPLGRAGMGAVFGAKRIKAIVVHDAGLANRPVDVRLFDSCVRSLHRLTRYCNKHPYEHPGAVQPDPIELSRRKGFAPVCNFSQRTDPRLVHLSYCGNTCTQPGSSAVSAESAGACSGSGCNAPSAMVCKTVGKLDYETLVMLGSNIGNFDASLVADWSRQCIDLGLDPCSVGNVLGWAIECGRQGLIDWAGQLVSGDFSSIPGTIDAIANRKNSGIHLGKGVVYLSRIFGGTEHALHAAGLEVSGYDGRGAWGQALMLAHGETGPCIPETVLTLSGARKKIGKASLVVFHEDLAAALRSLGFCAGASIPLVYGRLQSLLGTCRVVGELIFAFPWLANILVAPRLTARIFGAFADIKVSPAQLLRIGKRSRALRTLLQHMAPPPSPVAALPDRFLLEPTSNSPDQSVVPYGKLQRSYDAIRALDCILDEELSL